jgi:tripartite-type tricarboxylate transporter receptor subunit TctC
MRLSLRHAAALLSALVLGVTSGAAPVLAQDWPKKQAIKVIVPFTAGSSTDISARVVFEQVGRQVGQTVVVENRVGAGTTIGSAFVAKSDPDGYTILVNSSSHAAVAATYAKLSYHPANDFAGISPLADLPISVIAPLKYKTMADLVAAGQKGSLNFGSAGAGSAGHLFLERVRLAGRMNAVHIAFRGTPEGVTEILAGRIDFYVAPVLNAVPLVNEGKISALAVGSAKRAKSMPQVPTTEQAGLKDAGYEFWVGALVPVKTPRAIVDRLNREVLAALNLPEIADRIEKLGGEPMPMTPAEFDAFSRKEIATNVAIVTAAGFKPQ